MSLRGRAGILRSASYYCRKHGPRELLSITGRLLVLHGWSCRARRAVDARAGAGPPPALVRVDPRLVAETTIPKPYFPSDGPRAFTGPLGGPWDRCSIDFAGTALFRSLHDRFERGREWEETRIFQVTAWAVRNGISTWHGCRSESDIHANCRAVEELYAGMRGEGYVARAASIRRVEAPDEVPREGEKRVGDYLVPDELRLGIGRSGEFIRLGGARHRLAIARLLGIPRVPAVVIAWHAEAAT